MDQGRWLAFTARRLRWYTNDAFGSSCRQRICQARYIVCVDGLRRQTAGFGVGCLHSHLQIRQREKQQPDETLAHYLRIVGCMCTPFRTLILLGSAASSPEQATNPNTL